MHPTKTVYLNGVNIEIDEKIADLLEAMWAYGLDTSFSCQDKDGEAWIQMPAPSASEFMRIARENNIPIRAEYHGPAAVSAERDHNVYFNVKDSKKLVKCVGGAVGGSDRL